MDTKCLPSLPGFTTADDATGEYNEVYGQPNTGASIATAEDHESTYPDFFQTNLQWQLRVSDLHNNSL
jgi:hypothetical protein